MSLISFTVADFNPHFRGAGYVMSYVTQTVLRSRIVRLDAGDARVGYGEIISDPGLDLVKVAALEDGALDNIAEMALADLPALLGGLGIAQAARDLCTDCAIAVRIDGLWCGPVATAATLHLAVGAPPGLLIAGCDLREPLVLDEDWGGVLQTPGKCIAPVDSPGHGVIPPTHLWQSSRQVPGQPPAYADG